jgi:hypothetical protein
VAGTADIVERELTVLRRGAYDCHLVERIGTYRKYEGNRQPESSKDHAALSHAEISNTINQVGVRNVPLENCFGIFQAARAGRLRIKAKYPECQGLALRVASLGERHNDTNGEQGKEPARAHMLLFNRY